MSEDIQEITITPEDVIRFIGRNFIKVAIVVSVCAALSVIIAFQLPKTYKSRSVISIQSSYFRNPLVSDLISEVYDQGEQAAVRASLLRLALNDDFLDYLGEKYEVFQYPENHRLRTIERENLRSDIEYFTLTKTNFQVSVFASDPIVAYEMTREVIDQMMKTMIDERYSKLVNTRDAIKGSVDSLSRALEIPDPRVGFKRELESIEAEYQELSSKYTPEHPAVIRLRTKRQILRRAMENAEQQAHEQAMRDGEEVLSPSTRAPTQDIYNELLRKLNNLNIVVEMERNRDNIAYLGVVEPPEVPLRATFPNKTRFLFGGIIVGLLLAGIRVVVDELKRKYEVTPPRASDSLGVPLLGELPTLVDRSKIRLIEGPERLRELPKASGA